MKTRDRLCRFAIVIVLASSSAASNDGSFGTYLEVNPSFISVANGSFHDPEPSFVGPNGWLGHVRYGYGIGGRLLIALPYGIQPFVGYHAIFLAESAPNADLLQSIYAINYKMQSDGSPTVGTGYKLTGWDFGVIYEPKWIGLSFSPYVGAAVRTDKFNATTTFDGYMYDDYEGGYTHISGNSTLQTKNNLGFVVNLGLSFSINNISLVPEASYTASASTITARNSRWNWHVSEGPIGTETSPLYLSKEELLHKNFLQFGIGIRFQVF
jgi:hypothetical protein